MVFDTWYDSTYQPSSPLVDRCNALIELGRQATWPTGFQRPFNALVTGALDQEIATLQTEPGRGVAVLIGRGLGLTPPVTISYSATSWSTRPPDRGRRPFKRPC